MSQNRTESKAQQFLRKKFGSQAFIRKIPDFKQTGSKTGGLPDYIVISNKNTIWYEVKYLPITKKSFSINEFTTQQLITFAKMLYNGAEIMMLIYWGDKMYQVYYENIRRLFVDKFNNPISIKKFEEWDMNDKPI